MKLSRKMVVIKPMQKALKALIGLLSALAAIVVFELLLRLSGYMPEYWLRIKTLDNEAGKLHIQLDPRLLYRIKPGGQAGINNYGYRDYDFVGKPPGRYRILMLGDSFLMANNLAAAESIPKLLEQRLGPPFEVLNLGVSGYGPDQEYLALVDHGLKLEPDMVVLAIFAGNDFRDLDLNGLFTVNQQGEVEETTTNLVKESLPPLRIEMLLSMVLRHRYLDPEKEEKIAKAVVMDETEIINDPNAAETVKRSALMRGVVQRFQTLLKAKGVRFAAVILPSWLAFHNLAEAPAAPLDKIFINERAAAEICAAEKVPVLDESDDLLKAGGLALYDPSYRHFNERGTRAAAALLDDYLRRTFPEVFKR